jgi:hypothetical protein
MIHIEYDIYGQCEMVIKYLKTVLIFEIYIDWHINIQIIQPDEIWHDDTKWFGHKIEIENLQCELIFGQVEILQLDDLE